MITLTFNLCEYSANDTTKVPTSTQKTPITTTLSTSKTTKTNVQSKATTSMPIQTTTTERIIDETTTHIYPMGKDPRFGDNNITEAPGIGKMTTTSVDDLVTVINTITESPTTEDTTITTESLDKTTIPNDHSTKRPSRFETTLEFDYNYTTTEQITTKPTTSQSKLQTDGSTEPMDFTTTTTTTEQTTATKTTTQQTGDETTTNQILTVTEVTNDFNETSTSVSQTVGKTVGSTCKTKMECGINEICFKKQCIKVCKTNGNVTKLSDDCIKGTCANQLYCHEIQFTFDLIYNRIYSS